ncbi:rhodanese-like domain-containing protein 11, chloroplastic [Tanacetum coccineum]
MEVLNLSISTPFNNNNHKIHKAHLFNTSSFNHKPLQLHSLSTYKGIVVKAQASEEDYELKQVKDMAAARKRWEALVREGKVKLLTPKEAGYAIQLSGKTLLDVRPSTEHEKAWVRGSTWIPIFDTDTEFDIGTLSRKEVGGVAQFVAKVTEKFPKDTDLIVACQKGLRSLAACEQLYNAGYRNLFWVQGGLEAAEEEDLEREGPQPFKFAGIGGLSEFLGWTDQQRAQAAKEGWGYRLVFSARLVTTFEFFSIIYIRPPYSTLMKKGKMGGSVGWVMGQERKFFVVSKQMGLSIAAEALFMRFNKLLIIIRKLRGLREIASLVEISLS